MFKRFNNKKGFTIIEIMVVIALIGILSAVLVPKFSGVKDKAKEAGVLTNMKSVEGFIAATIDDCTTSTQLADKIVANFNADANKLENPLTSKTGSIKTTSDIATGIYTGIVGTDDSVLVIDATNASAVDPVSYAGTKLQGCVIVTCYSDGGVLTAEVVGMGNADTGASAVTPLGKFKKTYTK